MDTKINEDSDKKRKCSSDNTCSGLLKNPRNGRSPQGDITIDNSSNVIDLIHQANTVLFNDTLLLEDSVFESCEAEMATKCTKEVKTPPISTSQSTSTLNVPISTDSSPTDAVIDYLKRIETKLNHVDQRLNTLDTLEKKVSNFELDLKKLWIFVHDQNKRIDQKVSDIDQRVDNLEFALGQAQSEITEMHKDDSKTKDELLYVKSQSMRNNLIFGNIPELKNETHEQTESLLRTFLVEKLQIAHELVSNLKIERAHRMGYNNRNSLNPTPRRIVAKFAFFKDREMIRRQRVNLDKTDFFMHEQFPPEIAARRKALIPTLKAAQKQGRKSWIAYDTLYVDGLPVRDGKLPESASSGEKK